MAHDKCVGTWEKSKLGPAATAVDDGSGNFKGIFIVNPHDGDPGKFVPITGTHLGRQGVLLAGKCSGDEITFAAEDLLTKELICYLNGKITPDGGGLKNLIKGKFSRPLGAATAAGPDDDWQAEKPT